MSFRGRRRLRADPRAGAARSRAACCGGPGPCPEGMEFIVATTAAGAAEPSDRVEQPAAGSAAGARERQRTLAVDDAAATRQRATALHAMARHTARAAAGAASTLAAIQST